MASSTICTRQLFILSFHKFLRQMVSLGKYGKGTSKTCSGASGQTSDPDLLRGLHRKISFKVI